MQYARSLSEGILIKLFVFMSAQVADREWQGLGGALSFPVATTANFGIMEFGRIVYK